MKKKRSRMFVPSRASSELIDLVNVQRKADQKTWPQLVEILFHAYLKTGLPILGQKPRRALRKEEQ